jgi:hypothetical protein
MRLTLPSPESQLRSELAKLESRELSVIHKRVPPPVVTTLPVLSENERFDGYEIRFPGPITAELSEELKGAKFRYSGSNGDKRWYRRRSPQAHAFAVALIQRIGGVNQISGISSAVPAGQEKCPIIIPLSSGLQQKVNKILRAMEMAA